MTGTEIAGVFRETKKNLNKKVKQCRKDVGKGCEEEIRIVEERKSAVKEAGMGAKAGLMA